MFGVYRAINIRKPSIDLYRRWEEQKFCQLSSEEARAVTVIALAAYGFPLSTVPSFKLLGRIMSTLDVDWSTVVHNFSKYQKKWARLFRLIGR